MKKKKSIIITAVIIVLVAIIAIVLVKINSSNVSNKENKNFKADTENGIVSENSQNARHVMELVGNILD